MKKKFLSSLLALCMVLSMLPVTAFAAAPVSPTAVVSGDNKIATLTFAEAITDAASSALKAGVTFSSDSSTYAALAEGDTVVISDKTLIVTFATALTGATNTIKIAADTIQDASAAKNTEIVTSALVLQPDAPAASIDYAQELITGYATATMEASKTADFKATISGDLADATAFATANLIPATSTQDLYVRTKAAAGAPAGIAKKLDIPARPATPANSDAATLAQPAADAGVGETKVTLAVTSEFKITDSTGVTVRQDWTVGNATGANSSTSGKLVDGDQIWVRTKATDAAFASATATAAKTIATANIGIATDKSAATVALGTTGVTTGSVVAGATFDLAITAAKGTDGSTALTGAKNVTVTSSVNTDGTTGKVFDANVTFTSGSGTVTIPAEMVKKAGSTTLTVTIADVKTVTGSPVSVTVNPAAAAKLVVTTQPTAPATNGAVLAQQPVVQIQDKYDNVCTSSTDVITATAGAQAGWALTAPATATAVAGVATFSGLTATNAAAVTGATIKFNTGSLTEATSNAINLPAPVDATAPTLSATSASDITATGANLKFTSDEAGTYYYLVLAAADAAPDAATVKAQGTAVAKGTASASAAANTVAVTGLTASTAYKAYVIVADAATNLSTVTAIQVTTIAPADTTAPTLSTATINGTALVLTYNEDLKTTPVPATTDFTVTGIAAGNTVKSVAIAGSAVTLTMEKAAVSTDTVTVSYTVPGTNKIQDTAGNAAVALTSNAVTNSTAPATSSTAPAFASKGDTFTMTDTTAKAATYTLSTSAAAGTTFKAYDASTGGVASTAVSSVTATGTTLTLTLAAAPTKDATYYISATESGKTESTRTAVTVKAYVKSADATLSGLVVTTATIAPVFATGTTAYTASVANNVAKVTVTPTVTNAKATVKVNGTTVASAAASGDIALNVGANTITVLVTAEDGTTTKTYTITITRAAAPAVTAAVTGSNITGKVGTALNPDPTLTVTLTNGKFAASLTTASFTVTALPAGITIAEVTRTGDTVATIKLTGTPAAVQSATKIGVTVKKDALNPATSADVVATCNVTAAVTSDFAISSIGDEAVGGAGKTRAINVTGTFNGSQHLVIQTTEGTGDSAKVMVTMVALQVNTTSVTVSYKTTGTTVQAWIASAMPTLNGSSATGATIYAYATTTKA